MTETTPQTFLDKPAVLALRLNWEKIAWIVLILLALILRVYDVGARVMSHDESLHTTYSHHLYSGVGFKHDPLMHGPLLFHATAFGYFLFGPSDFSARLPVVLLGVGVVWLMWLTRSWLGKVGAFAAAALMTFSPTLLYHSRYIRHDIYAILFITAVAILGFRYIQKGENKWLLLMAAALGLSFTTKEVAFISAVIIVGFFLLWVLIRWAFSEWEESRFKIPFFIVLAFGGALAVYPMYESIKAPVGELVTSARLGGFVVWPLLLVGGIMVALALVMLWIGYGRERLLAQRDTEVAVWILTLSAPLFAAFPIKIFGSNPQSINLSGDLLNPQTLTAAGVFLVMALIFHGLGVLWSRSRYLAGLGIFYGLMLLFFTTFFTNGNGLATGLVGSVGYWLAQQEVARGGQPWYYYFLLVPLYEFLPLLLSLFAMVSIAWRAIKRLPFDDDNDGANASYTVRRQWLLWLVWLFFTTWGAYTWAGEKMPWLTTHFAIPMTMLGGWYLARRIRGVDWRNAWHNGAVWLLIGVPLWALVLIALLRLRPFQGASLNQLSDTMGFVVALLLLVGLSWVLVKQILKLGGKLTRQMIFFALIGILSFMSVRTAFMASYVNYDLAVEPLVYAHAAPDIKKVVDDLNEISRRTVGEGQLAFAYDDQTTWPFEWYFRDFPNKKFFGGNPSRDYLKDAPVVLVGTENEDKVKPYLGNDYYRIPYRQIWWPKETYKGLTLERMNEWLRDPQALRNFWDVLIYRRYQQPLADWDPSDRFVMFIRKDIAAQVWDLGAAPEIIAEAVADPFEEKYRLEPAIQILGGASGAGEGQLQQPRNVAAGPDGRVYVADTGNHRIVVFDDDGSYGFEWGGFGEAPGQFNEPWGIAASADGTIYVADTWNHRIQAFDGDGNLINTWGGFVSSDGQLGQLGVFWGPRGVAVDQEGNVLVSDTGNKRVQVFAADGTALTQFGGGGVEPGFLEEPVGVAVGPDGSVYVADTWNQRLQKFDANYQFVKEWSVPGWDDEGIFNKPYIAVDSEGTVYASDPVGWRVFVWDSEGNPQAVLGQFGNTGADFAYPNGVAIGSGDTLWVADADNHRVMRFAPVR